MGMPHSAVSSERQLIFFDRNNKTRRHLDINQVHNREIELSKADDNSVRGNYLIPVKTRLPLSTEPARANPAGRDAQSNSAGRFSGANRRFAGDRGGEASRAHATPAGIHLIRGQRRQRHAPAIERFGVAAAVEPQPAARAARAFHARVGGGAGSGGSHGTRSIESRIRRQAHDAIPAPPVRSPPEAL